ncbi:1,4-dihydroxy-2-naphthoate octaprenyltransferase [Phaeovibrio sulfidiphilus]|uniref:1,4-dihydroxy-2-naphthoate octaprenyltransferase n=1 Tax=Phaeovibrio sulfidiphilus TaxID=1220600 RepID=A0A8J6YWY7_9PROT|nr:1,4-dihydroxy-2-naphthoate octaprenyltransferase [Phaeovibrio sulfidiphilus]MBE1236218.1 1,4-dihydroxy-2-naphthoate octaprenyltransferase [Phaeovibrio sulfidiphilus]
MTLPRPGWFQVWMAAIRPRTLPLSMTPVVAASVLGWVQTGQVRPDVILAALVTAVGIQIGTNLHNDAVDGLDGTDDDTRVGPVRVTQQGWLPARTVFRAAHLTFACAFLAGLYLCILGGWWLLLPGVASILAGYAYSAGPLPLSRYPFAELFVILFFGLVAVGGVAWVYTGTLGLAAVLLGLAVGFPAAAVLMVNNTRDREGDARAGRRTLAIVLGRRGATKAYRFLLLGGVIAALFLALSDLAYLGAVASLACVPLAFRLAEAFRTADDGPAFNRLLARTSAYTVSLAAAIGLGLVVMRTAFF